MKVRVRLVFEYAPSEYARKSWFLFDPSEYRTVGDVARLIGRRFDIRNSVLELYVDGFLLPVNESVGIVRDNDCISVQCRKLQLLDSTSNSCDDDAPVEGSAPSTRAEAASHKERKRARTAAMKLAPASPSHSPPPPPPPPLPPHLLAPHARASEAHPRDRLKKKKKREKQELQSEPKTPEQTDVGSTPKTVGGPKAVSVPCVQPRLETAPKDKPLRSSVTKSSAGGLHVRFHSSSDDDDDDNSEPNGTGTGTGGVAPPIGDIIVGGAPPLPPPPPKKPLPTEAPPSSDVTALSGPSWKGKGRGKEKEKEKGNQASEKKRKKKNKSRAVVGGPSDVFSTKSNVYWKKPPSADTSNSAGASASVVPVGTTPLAPPTATSTLASNGAASPRADPVANRAEGSAAAADIIERASPSSFPSSPPPPGPSADHMQQQQEEREVAALRDYGSLPGLEGPPRPGDEIAFKLLELNASDCTPQISKYKVGKVLAYDTKSKSVQVKLSEATLRLALAEENDCEGALNKFRLHSSSGEEESDEENGHGQKRLEDMDPQVELSLEMLIQPKLIVT